MSAFRSTRPSRRLALTVSACASLAAAIATPAWCAPSAPGADGQEVELKRVAIGGDRLGGFVLPVAPLATNLVMSASKAWTWQVDDTQRLELRGDVRIRVGSYSFSAERAWVWINRLPTAQGEVNQIAIYFEEASEPTRRAGFGAAGKDLLVTASARGDISLRVTERVERAPATTAGLRRGNQRLAGYLRSLLTSIDDGTARLSPILAVDAPTAPVDPPPVPGAPAIPPEVADARRGPGSVDVPMPDEPLPIVRPEGQVSFSATDILVEQSSDSISITGSVMVQYDGDAPEGPQRLEMRAERAVLFLREGVLAGLREGSRTLGAESILGIYLEGGVTATDGNYTVRGSRIYYDFVNNRATVMDAVLRTYARLSRTLTLYARAAEMRQVSRTEFQADQATVSASEFFVPHLSVGAERVTVTQPPDGSDLPMRLVADDITLRAGRIPFFFLPGYEGDIAPNPLREIEMSYDENYGAEILTRWDLYQLLGMAPPEGVDADFTFGGYTSRGPAVGSRWSYRKGLTAGSIEGFGMYDGGGTDRTAGGVDVEQDATFRGILDGEFQTYLSPELQLQTQLAYASDRTFVSAWRKGEFAERREYETSAYLKSQSENTALTLLAKHNLNDWLQNSYLLAGPGYSVDKLPDLGYRRYGDNIFDGLLWTQRWGASLMSIRPTTGTPASLGVRPAAFGLSGRFIEIDEAYFDAGYSDNYVTRVHTRHELSLPWSEANWTLTPFASAEASGYFLEDFAAYSSESEDIRYLAGGGVRASARFVRIDDTAESWLFDIHRLRHIIEPNATLWGGWANDELGDTPIYDQDIEGTSGGAAAQLGVRQQWQTQRGGAGAWESVNFLTLDTGAVINDKGSEFQQSDAQDPLVMAQSALPAFYAWRPELSQWGSHLYGLASWQISDTFTLAGTANYLLEDRDTVTRPNSPLENLARGSLGLEMRHTPDVRTYVEYRYIAPTDSELLQLGILYQVGRKYLIAFSPQYDLNAGEMRSIRGSLGRSFPDFNLNLTAGYDLIEDQTSVAVSLRIPADYGSSNAISSLAGGRRFGDVR